MPDPSEGTAEPFDVAFLAPRAVVDDVERPCVVGVRAGRIAAIAPLGEPVKAAELIRLREGEVLLLGLVDTPGGGVFRAAER
jgi:hypothetical protein